MYFYLIFSLKHLWPLKYWKRNQCYCQLMNEDTEIYRVEVQGHRINSFGHSSFQELWNTVSHILFHHNATVFNAGVKLCVYMYAHPIQMQRLYFSFHLMNGTHKKWPLNHNMRYKIPLNFIILNSHTRSKTKLK